MSVAHSPSRAVVAGLGKTGYSAARFLHARGALLAVTDSRESPPELERLRALDAQIPVRTGALDETLLSQADLLVVSPGLERVGSFFERARARGLPMVGDIELFVQAAHAPIAAVTGSNGKSTVTTLLARMAAVAGLKARAGGNLGPPALELLDDSCELYVLELSSFQLELVDSLGAKAAAVLNVSADHMDRYATLAQYAAAKARVYRHCECAVINADDRQVTAMIASPSARPPDAAAAPARVLSFSLRAGAPTDYGLVVRGAERWLARRGEPLIALSALKVPGLHNAANALAALALGEALALSQPAMLAALREFPGLAHRTQWIGQVRGVGYIDDSKGTNVGATVAAVQGLPGPLIVIAGGQGKGQDFSPLAEAFRGKVRAAVLIGRDANALGAVLEPVCPCHHCASLEAAVVKAAELAHSGDTVLLSPACASLDMFRDYAERGSVFVEAVGRLAA